MAKKKQKGTLFGKPKSQVIKRPGAFSAKAKAAGMSTSAYAAHVLREGSTASTRTKRQAALARTFAKWRKRKR
jgi:hypothetical protein